MKSIPRGWHSSRSDSAEPLPLPRILIIIPTYNERENIASLVTRVLAQVPSAELVVVDDSSPDGTAAEVERMQRADSRIHLLVRAERGLGSAYGAGFDFGLKRGFAWLITMDADSSHDPVHLPSMLAALMENDVVVGSRYILDGGTINWRLRRILLSWLANRFARFVLRMPGHDLTSGYRGYRADILVRINPQSLLSTGYSYLVEMLYLCLCAKARIAEVPIVFFDRRLGESKISRWEIIRGALRLIQLRFSGKRKRP